MVAAGHGGDMGVDALLLPCEHAAGHLGGTALHPEADGHRPRHMDHADRTDRGSGEAAGFWRAARRYHRHHQLDIGAAALRKRMKKNT